MHSCDVSADTVGVTLAGAAHGALAIVVVHPTWPWESRGDYAPGQRARKLMRCGLILSRIADRLPELPSAYRFLIGPYINQASYLPKTVTADILTIEGAIPPVNTHGDHYGNSHLDMAATWSAYSLSLLPSLREVWVTGFWRESCCAHAAKRMKQMLPKVKIRVPKSLSA